MSDVKDLDECAHRGSTTKPCAVLCLMSDVKDLDECAHRGSTTKPCAVLCLMSDVKDLDECAHRGSTTKLYIRMQYAFQLIYIGTPVLLYSISLSNLWMIVTFCILSFKRCRYNMCKWETDNSLADAVIFRAGAIRTWKIKPFPRKPGSRLDPFVILDKESS